MFGGFTGIQLYLVAFSVSIIPAILLALIVGARRRDTGSEIASFIFGLRFEVRDVVICYVVLSVIAYGVLNAGKPKPATYDLELALQGPPSALQSFLPNLNDLQVSIESQKDLGWGINFVGFAYDSAHTKLRSTVAAPRPLPVESYSIVVYPKKTESVALGLTAKTIALSNQMEATLVIEPVANPGRQEGPDAAATAVEP